MNQDLSYLKKQKKQRLSVAKWIAGISLIVGILALAVMSGPNDGIGSTSWKPAPVFAQSCAPNAIDRFGVNVALEAGPIGDYPVDQLNLGWYMDYNHEKSADSPIGLEFAHMIRTRYDTSTFDRLLGPVIDANPGALWLAGNEPDRSGQDGVTAEEYAVFYHDVYTFIKNRDSSASVAFGGLVMPTKLRQKYLDKVVDEYQRRYGQNPPADVVHVHGFIMSEVVFPEPDQVFWGAGVPPGMSGTDPAIQYVAPEDHWNINILKSNLVSFRQWMANNGYRNTPLIISEYGILLSNGWDQNGIGTANFMTSSFDLFLEQTNSATGLRADGNRLVQKFSWFSLNFPDDTAQGVLNGTLFVPNTSQLTPLGRAFKEYTTDLIQDCNIAPTPVPQPLGDVDCRNGINAVDALFVLQYTVGFRSDGGSCPMSDPDNEINARAGDVNSRNGANAVDALFILQCVVGVPNVLCGGVAAADTAEAGAVEFTTVYNEETISIQADMNDTSLAAGTFKLTYDSSKALLTDCSLSQQGACNISTPGIVHFSFVNVNGISGQQPIAELTFDSANIDIDEFTATSLADTNGRRLVYSLRSDQESTPEQFDSLERIFVPLISR